MNRRRPMIDDLIFARSARALTRARTYASPRSASKRRVSVKPNVAVLSFMRALMCSCSRTAESMLSDETTAVEPDRGVSYFKWADILIPVCRERYPPSLRYVTAALPVLPSDLVWSEIPRSPSRPYAEYIEVNINAYVRIHFVMPYAHGLLSLQYR